MAIPEEIDASSWMPRQKRRPPVETMLRYLGPTIVPSESASVSITIAVGVAEEPGEVLQGDVIHVDIRVLGYTNSLAARRYRR